MDRVVNIQYLSGTGTICVVFEGGDVVTISGGDPHIEIVGSIDSGIHAARWSPDEELLVAVTKANNVIFMGSTLDPVAEVPLTDNDLAASKHVSVGWGKKETQFEGRGAKALRDPTIPEKVDQGLPSAYEDGGVCISWRGDGAFVAVNSVQQGTRRVIRVYSREGELDSASEPVDGFETALSWRPSGNLIAGIQRLSDRIDVVFFERNGLRHGQFTLRSPRGAVLDSTKIRLEWNSDSTVLAVILQDTIQLWTTGNYHWYLKQEIPYPGSQFNALSWHPERALRFATTSPQELFSAEGVLQAARGSCYPPNDIGAVAVIDGETVKLTPFRTANVPPPYAFFEVTAESSVVDVAFTRQNTAFAILHHTGVDCYELAIKNKRATKPTLVRRIQFPTSSGFVTPLRISASSQDSFHYITYQEGEQSHFNLPLNSDFPIPVESTKSITSTATYETSSVTEGYGQDATGKLYRLTDSEVEMLPVQFSNELPQFEITKTEDESVVAFGLSRSGHLFANSRLLAKNCTSFITTPDHLIFTTSNHFVKYVHLGDAEELEVPGDDPEKDERCRSVERGSRLVTAIPTNASIVLQMPRGNLETIFPRAMVLAAIRKRVDAKDYESAFAYCRTQRVDMNILYDYQPEQFLANVSLFLDQLQDIGYIDLFLSSLREEDVTQTMYQDTRRRVQPIIPTEPAANAPSKINIVCDAVLKGLQSRKSTNLQNIITAHVCKSPPALEDGLLLVADLRKTSDVKMAEAAIEHICFLVDVNRLYETALGMYNLDLTLLVAQQSQRDPREYLPFMQHLHSLEELRRRFEIDDHLNRRAKALTHLHALADFDGLCTYTTKHALYQPALKLYRYDQPRLRTLTGLYASYLEDTSSFREAGLAYESLQDYAKATSCYRAVGSICWQECLFAAQQQQLSPDAMSDLANALAEALYEAKDFSAAATIQVDYLDSLETAIKWLCKGYYFAEAMRLIARHARPELLTSTLDVGLADALGSTTEFLADCKGQLASQVPRIAELRRKAAEDPLAFYEGERAGGADLPDDVSVAASSRISTSASLFTRYTGKAGSVGTLGTGVSRATSKNRRREEKKRARGRKGTVYEEEYLVNSVRRLIERVSTTKAEVERLVFALVRRDMAERARNAESLLADLVAACEVAVTEVFPAAGAGAAGLNDVAGAEAMDTQQEWKATGADAVVQDWIAGRAKMAEPPVLTKMDKLSLLG